MSRGSFHTSHDQEQWIQIFDIPETKLHQDGYTVYKISSTLLHRAFPEASTSLEVWRRYSAVLQLHKEVIKISSHLQLPDQPPPYSKPSMIKRFDHETVESRKKYILTLLNYCAKYSSIYSSDQFTDFFKEDFNMKKKRLSFSRLREKRRHSSLASSLGLPQNNVSLYSHMDEHTSSSEDLSGKASARESGEEIQHTSRVISNKGPELMGRESSQNCRVSSERESINDVSLPSHLGWREICSLSDRQDLASHTGTSLDSKGDLKVPLLQHSMKQRQGDTNCDPKQHSGTHFPAAETGVSKNLVRTKTSEYLQKAEQLIARLSLRETKQGQNTSVSFLNPQKENPLQSSSLNLRNYRVVGISGNVIAAVDVTTQETVAIKIVAKSSEEKCSQLVLPLNVPSMVPIIRYHETDFAFYIILKYISGGKLWNHLKKFIKQPLPYSGDERKVSTTYEGQRLIFDYEESREKDSLLSVQTNVEFEASEVDQESVSFGIDPAVAECKSSLENYSIPYPVNVERYQASLSNIIDLPRNSVGRGIMDNASFLPTSINYGSSSRVDQSSLDKQEGTNDTGNFDGKAKGRWMTSLIDVDNLDGACDIRSVGSDTLSGVSDDFSCSSFNLVAEEMVGSDQGTHDPSLALSSSFSSLAMKETSESSNFDVTSLIKNSKKLIEDVNKTLERSKRQIIRTFSSSKDSDPSETVISKKEKKVPKKLPAQCCTATEKEQPNLPILYTDPHGPPSIDIPDQRGNNNNAHSLASKEGHCISFPNFKENSTVTEQADTEPSSDHTTLEPRNELDNVCSTTTDVKTEDWFCPSSNHHNPSKVTTVSSLVNNYSSNRTEEGHQQVPEGLARVWLSQVVSAMDSLHQQDIIWGDFNPSNLLLDEGGSILVTYKCFYGNPKHYGCASLWRRGESSKRDWLSSMGYLSPELLNPVSMATQASDWWSVGALLFHLLTGKDVASCHPSGITSHTQINFVSSVSEEAASLISNLLCVHPMERLGSSLTGVQEIKDHPFFIGITWPE